MSRGSNYIDITKFENFIKEIFSWNHYGKKVYHDFLNALFKIQVNVDIKQYRF